MAYVDSEMAVITMWSATKMHSLVVPRAEVDHVFNLLTEGQPFIVKAKGPAKGEVVQTLINPHWIEFVRVGWAVSVDDSAEKIGASNGQTPTAYRAPTAYTEIFPQPPGDEPQAP